MFIQSACFKRGGCNEAYLAYGQAQDQGLGVTLTGDMMLLATLKLDFVRLCDWECLSTISSSNVLSILQKECAR